MTDNPREGGAFALDLRMPDDERLRAMDYLLRVSQIAGEVFDALERNAMTAREAQMVLQLSAHVNTFGRIMADHAEKLTRGER